VAVGSRGASARLVEGLEGAREQQDRDVAQAGITLDRLANLVPVLPRHDDVGEDDVRLQLPRARDRVIAVADRRDPKVLVRESDPDDLLDRDRVVREEKVLGHGVPGAAEGGKDRT
jgi:hypothetical protein